MKQYALALLGAALLFSLTSCAIPQQRSVYIYTVKKYCPNGFILMTDNTCRTQESLNKSFFRSSDIAIPKTKKKAVKRAKKTVKREINCKQVLTDINQCMR